MLNPVAMSIITNTFTDPRERAQADADEGPAEAFAATRAREPDLLQ